MNQAFQSRPPLDVAQQGQLLDQAFDFTGKNVFVAGGTSGINFGIALLFAQQGANVAVLSRSQEKVDRAVEELTKQATHTEQKSLGFSADVRDYTAIEQALQACHKAWGDLDVVVSGAAGNFPAMAKDLSPNGFKAVIDIDLLGTFHVNKAAYAVLKKPGGSIINISAPQAFIAMELQVHVCAAKAGVDMVTKVLAQEWGPDGLRVNSIVPGPIDHTEGMDRLAPTPAIKQAVADSVPTRQMGDRLDVARAALYLASPIAAFVSGVILPADSGWHLSGAQAAMLQSARMFEHLQSKP